MLTSRNKIFRMFPIVIALVLFPLATTAVAQNNSQTPSGIAFYDLENQIDTYLEKQIGQTIPGATVCVVKDGQVVFQKGYGYADVENQTPVDVKNTVFEYGSISKLFVWTSAMQLVEQGKLKLDEDIKSYLPTEIASKLNYPYTITMYDLMSHTAGFEQQSFDWKPFPLDPPDTPLSVSLVKHQPKQVYQPKTVIAYSNYGAALAGLVVEQISGQRFYDYEKNYIFEPSGMKMITGHPSLADSPNLAKTKAKGYIPIGNGQFKPGPWTYLSEYPAGSVNGTIESLGRYLIALTPEPSQGTPLFSQKSTLQQMLLQSYTPYANVSSNAHGFWEYDGAQRSLWHSGNTAAFTTFFAFVPEQRFGFAILTNAAGAIDPVHGLGELLLGKSDNYSSKQAQLPPANTIAGKYMSSMYSHTTFLAALSYLTQMATVNAIGDNEIEVKMRGKTARYTQTSAYFYELSSQANPETKFNRSYLYFQLQDGKVQRISGGHFMDMIPLPTGRTLPYLWFSILTAVVASLFFTIAPFVLLVSWRRQKGKAFGVSKSALFKNHFTVILVLLGTFLIFNNAYLLCSAALTALLLPSQVRIQVTMNWIILLAAIVLFIITMYRHKRFHFIKGQHPFSILTLCMFAITIYLLYHWNFFIWF